MRVPDAVGRNPSGGVPGEPAAVGGLQTSEDFVELVKWRTGCDGRITALKRAFGMRRTHLIGLAGARTGTGHVVLAHNLTKLGQLTGLRAS